MNSYYKKMYLHLFNKVTDALRLLPEEPERAAELLEKAQQSCEEMYVEADGD